MKVRTLIAGYVLALALLLFAQRHPGSSPQTGFRSVVDLTHSIDPPASTRNPQYRLKTVARTDESEPSFIHGFSPVQTRIEAPARFSPGLWTVDQIPAERLIAPLVVFDLRSKVSAAPDYQLSIDDIVQWEQAHGQIPLGSVVMLRTGWDARGVSAKNCSNPDRAGVTPCPGYSLDAAKFLVEGRTAVSLGIDTPAVDRMPSKDFPVRQYTLAHSVYQLENVANLDRVPATGSTVVAAPAKTGNGTRGPVRILAMIP